LGGTFFPAFLAFDNPMAMACLGLVTFLPLRPDLSLPFFISLISVSTFLPAEGEYLRPEDFLAEDFLAEDFLAAVFFAPVRFFVVLFFEEERLLEELLFLVLPDLFFAAFFVAIYFLPRKSDVHRIQVSCMAISARVFK
jgi:hypothetical protein